MTIVPPTIREGLYDLSHPARTNVAALDVLRSAAILLVFTGHYVGVFPASPAVQNFPIFRWGWTGVDLFFVLSGLLIGSQLFKELDRTGYIRIPRFLLRRGLRIWPLYYCFVLFAASSVLVGKNISRLWFDVLFISNFFFPSLVNGGWSLSTEEQFYILTPIVLALVAIKLPLRRMWIVPCLVICGLISTRAWVIAQSSLPEAALRQKLYFPIYTHADALAVGVFLAWLSVVHKNRLHSRVFSIGAAAAMFACGILLYAVKPLLLNFTALGLIYGSLELYGISALPLPNLIRWRGFYLVSRLSFGLYLNHFAVLALMHRWFANQAGRGIVGLWAVYFASLIAGLMVATVTFLLVEWPFLQIRARWLDRERFGAPTKAAIRVRAIKQPSMSGAVLRPDNRCNDVDVESKHETPVGI